MDKKLTVVTARGYTKKEALANAGITLDVKYDATIAWRKDNKPEGTELETFAGEYITDKVKDTPGVGFSITVESGQEDTREHPYKVIDVVTKGATKYTMVYEGLVGYDNNNTGTIVFAKKGKSTAVKAAKDYVTLNKVPVKIRKAHVVVSGAAEAAVVEYKPAVGTTLGTYIFFGYEN